MKNVTNATIYGAAGAAIGFSIVHFTPLKKHKHLAIGLAIALGITGVIVGNNS